jgi:hypothetical protein
MRMQFVLGIKGDDSIEQKFEKAIKENKNLHMQLIQSFGQAVLLVLRLGEEDNVTIDNFRAEKLVEGPLPQKNDVKKKVDK